MGHTLHWDVAMFLTIFGTVTGGPVCPPVGPMSLGWHSIFGRLCRMNIGAGVMMRDDTDARYFYTSRF